MPRAVQRLRALSLWRDAGRPHGRRQVVRIVSLVDVPGSVSLKCDPGYAVALREQSPAVTAGYNLNMRHWNTVQLEGSVPDEVLAEWIQDSYDLAMAG